jgi:hypothetical protein
MSAQALRTAREMTERVYEQRARSRLLDRLNGIIPSCAGCGKILEPGEKVEERIEGPVCIECIDKECAG